MNMLQQIKDVRESSKYLWIRGKTKKDRYKEILKALEGLIEGRAYLPENYIDNIAGLKIWYKVKNGLCGLSYRQVRNNVIRYIKTGKLLKRPYNISNTEDFNL